MTFLEHEVFSKDALTIYPRFNALQLTYLLSTIAFARRISSISGDVILKNNASSMKNAFSERGIPVIVRARDEQEDLPKLLFSLSRSNTPVNPIIVDNGSSDATPYIGKSLGLTVITEKRIGVVPASISAFNYIREANLHTQPVLFSDADSIPGMKWASSMISLLGKMGRSGGIAYGLYAYFGGQLLSDSLLTSAYHMKSLLSFNLRNKVTAHGGNSGIKFDQDGKILEACTHLDPKFTIGLGGLIRDKVKGANGIAIRSFNPFTLSPTRSDRMPDLYSVFKLFISHRKAITEHYKEWFKDHPGYDYNVFMDAIKNNPNKS